MRYMVSCKDRTFVTSRGCTSGRSFQFSRLRQVIQSYSSGLQRVNTSKWTFLSTAHFTRPSTYSHTGRTRGRVSTVSFSGNDVPQVLELWSEWWVDHLAITSDVRLCQTNNRARKPPLTTCYSFGRSVRRSIGQPSRRSVTHSLTQLQTG